MSKICLFIWRFQPAHYGTVDAIQQIVDAGYTHILFGVGSGDKEFTPDNPLTYTERKKMLQNLMQTHFPTLTADYATIPDFGDNDAWLNYITTNLPAFDAVASGNDWTKDIFSARGYSIVSLQVRKFAKASNIRAFIKENEREKTRDILPETTRKLLQEHDLTDRLRAISPPMERKVIVHLQISINGKTETHTLNSDKTILDNLHDLTKISFDNIPQPAIKEMITEYEHIFTLCYIL